MSLLLVSVFSVWKYVEQKEIFKVEFLDYLPVFLGPEFYNIAVGLGLKLLQQENDSEREGLLGVTKSCC